MTVKEIDRMFMQYLEECLCTFEAPHNYTGEERLEVYRLAFQKVIIEKMNK